jgi:hypothetical protein
VGCASVRLYEGSGFPSFVPLILRVPNVQTAPFIARSLQLRSTTVLDGFEFEIRQRIETRGSPVHSSSMRPIIHSLSHLS